MVTSQSEMLGLCHSHINSISFSSTEVLPNCIVSCSFLGVMIILSPKIKDVESL